MEIVISNIQRFCVHDGAGIRTTVFLKGCSLNCPWCANPEAISKKIEFGYGYKISLDDLKKEILKDKVFYQNGGGVTFSGGEPLLQISRYEPLLKELKTQDINICFETSLFVPKENLNIALKYCDQFLIDIKILEKENCKKLLNGNSETYFDNMELLFEKKRNVTFRIPLIKNYTYTEENINLILALLKKYPPLKVEMFQVHDFAKSKYDKINKKFNKFERLSDSEIILLKVKIEALNIDTEIINI